MVLLTKNQETKDQSLLYLAHRSSLVKTQIFIVSGTQGSDVCSIVSETISALQYE